MDDFLPSDQDSAELDELGNQIRNSLARRVSTSTEGVRTPRRTSPQTEDEIVTAVNLAKAEVTPVWFRFSLEGTGEEHANKALRFGKDFVEGPNGLIHKNLEVTFGTTYEELKEKIQDQVLTPFNVEFYDGRLRGCVLYARPSRQTQYSPTTVETAPKDKLTPFLENTFLQTIVERAFPVVDTPAVATSSSSPSAASEDSSLSSPESSSESNALKAYLIDLVVTAKRLSTSTKRKARPEPEIQQLHAIPTCIVGAHQHPSVKLDLSQPARSSRFCEFLAKLTLAGTPSHVRSEEYPESRLNRAQELNQQGTLMLLNLLP
jgi:hypothetical protein